MAGYDALNDLFTCSDPAAYASYLSTWHQANSGLFPRSLALDQKSVDDGKMRHDLHPLRHEEGRPSQ